MEDPDLLEDFAKAVSFYTGSPTDCYWRLVVEIDPDERVAWRRKQKMFLARYARQSLLQWDDVDVTELDFLVDDLLELLKMENRTGGEEFNGG